jgi:uncharacterized protein (TIGR03086 family)
MELVDGLEQTFDRAHTVIGNIRPDQLGDRTPCTDWDVRALLTHVVGVVSMMGPAARGETPTTPPDQFPLGDDPAAQFRAGADAALDAFRAPGVMDETMNGGAGPMPGAVYAGILMLDTTTHTWDLATATGQAPGLDEACAALALEQARMIVSPELRPGRFGEEVAVPDDAGATEQLVAFLGRQPRVTA